MDDFQDFDVRGKQEITVNGTAAAASNELVAAPGAGLRLVVTAFVIQNESQTATTAQLHSGATATAGWRFLGQNQGDFLSMSFARGQEWRLAENEALTLALSGTNSHGYSVRYFTEQV